MEEPIIPELKADEQPEVTEIESVCFHCYKTGTTRLLVVKIAFFREVIISSFSCPHCGFENRSLEPAARIQNKGQRIVLNVRSQKDINRRAVRPAGSSIEIPELDASFPTSDGDVSTIEGIILGIADNIEKLQPERKLKQPDIAAKLQTFLGQLRGLLLLEKPFTLIMDDPSGNGFIENYLAPDKDPQLEITLYQRTPEQDAALGIRPDSDDETPNGVVASSDATHETSLPDDRIGEDEVLNFNVNCPNCNAPSTTRMKLVDIPHFKQIVLMATVCPECGHKDSEVKASGGISPKGRFYRLKLTHAADLSRDVLISETSGIRIPELDLESMGGTLGGRFTTLEGLLLAVSDQVTCNAPHFVASAYQCLSICVGG